MGDNFSKRKEIGIKDRLKDHKNIKGRYKRILDTFGVKCHLGGKPGQSRLSTPFHIVEKMIETEGPEETDSQTISVLDSEDENGTSACVTHSTRNISNSQASLMAFRALEDFVEKRESLSPWN